MGNKVCEATAVLLLLVIGSLFSVCAAEHRKLAHEIAGQEMVQKDGSAASSVEGASTSHHPRSLMVKTNDYGRYDPAPAFSKPRFKLIPN